MAPENPFVMEVLDRLQIAAAATSRKMFGGYGIFHDGTMFALIADNELYLKADHKSSHYFDAMNLPPFSYTKAEGKILKMSYYLAPESFFEEPEQTLLWAKRALDASRRAAANKNKPSKKIK